MGKRTQIKSTILFLNLYVSYFLYLKIYNAKLKAKIFIICLCSDIKKKFIW